MPSYSQYKRQMAVMDADDANIETWITVKGNHIPIMKGQSKEEAVQSFLEKKGKSSSGAKTVMKPDIEKPRSTTVVSKGSGKAKYKVGDVTKQGKIKEVIPARLSDTPYYKLENGKTYLEEELHAEKPAKKEVTYTSELLKTPESQKLYDQIGEYAKRKKDDLDSSQMDHLIALRKILLTDNNATPHVKKNFEKWFGAMPDETESDKDFMKRKLGEWKEKDSVAKKRTELGKAWRNGEMSDKEFAAKSNSITESERYNRPVHIGEAVRNVVKKIGEQRAESKKPAGGSSSGWPESPKFEKLTEKYMPKSGAADNELGEALRSINQAVYRYYNDGDMYNKGYGKETVNAAIKHLTQLSKNKATPRHIARGIDNGLYELKTYGLKDKGRYETALKILLQTFEFADEKDIDALSKMKRNNG